MQRHEFHHDGLGLSYLDTGQRAAVLIALHVGVGRDLLRLVRQ